MINFLSGVFILAVILIILSGFIAFLINAFKDGRKDDYEETVFDYETDPDYVESTYRVWDTSVHMSTLLVEALDLYDKSNIRIPKDIIEDATIHHFDTVERAIQYIENQRNYWKLENQKKVLK